VKALLCNSNDCGLYSCQREPRLSLEKAAWKRQEDLIATAVTTVLVFSSHNIILAILSYKTDEVIDHRLEATEEVTKPFPHVDGDT